MPMMCHPADELAALRSEMRRLKAREMELRRMLLHGGFGLRGAAYDAVLQ